MDAPLALPPWLMEAGRVHAFDPARQCVPDYPNFTGIRVYRDALTAEETEHLMREIEAVPFVPSQSGRHKQHYGPRFNFTRKRMNADRFEGLPDYAHALESRLRDCVGGDEAGDPAELEACRTALAAFEATDAFVLRYFEREESNLDFHVDDLFAYGEAIVDVSLDSDSVLTFLGPSGAGASAGELVCVRVPLPARSIAVVHGPARFAWQHAILARDIDGVRTSITLRTLGGALRATDAGRQVLFRARPRT